MQDVDEFVYAVAVRITQKEVIFSPIAFLREVKINFILSAVRRFVNTDRIYMTIREARKAPNDG